MIAVIGAGPAGCAAAILLARAGRRVALLERQAAAQDSVCGEFLGSDAAAALARLGLHPATLGGAPIRRGRVAWGARRASFALPFAAWGLPRRTLDGALRDAAVAAGADLQAGCTVLGAEPVATGWRLRLDGGALDAATVLLATGKHALRGHPRADAPPGALGLKLHLDGVATAGAVTLLPFAGGYAGLQPLPDGGANLCAALHDAPPGLARDARAFVAAVASGSALGAALLAGAQPRQARPLAIAAVPYGFRQVAPPPPGLFRLGDQALVIPSFTGAGIALALRSGIAAAEAILRGEDAATFQRVWGARGGRPMRWAMAGAALLGRAPSAFAWGAGFAPAARFLARRTRVA